jgi:predicted acylesterase/phospholipase RssA
MLKLILIFQFFLTTALMAQLPFNRALILNGGGNNYLIGIGEYLALKSTERSDKKNYSPDLIIGTCGGSIASTIIYMFPDPKELKAFLKTKLYHLFQFDIKTSNSIRKAIGSKLSKRYFPNKYFSQYMLDVPQQFNYHITYSNGEPIGYFHLTENDKTFYQFSLISEIKKLELRFLKMMNSTLSEIEKNKYTNLYYSWRKQVDLMFIYTKADQSKEEIIEKKGKLHPTFTENIYSSSNHIEEEIKNLMLIKNPNELLSEIYFKNLEENTEKPRVKYLEFNNHELTLFQALRAAISEPFLMQPFEIDSKEKNQHTFFMAGSVNGIPKEYVEVLANQYTINNVGKIVGFDNLFKNLYGYSTTERFNSIQQELSDNVLKNLDANFRIIDLSKASKKLESISANLMPTGKKFFSLDSFSFDLTPYIKSHNEFIHMDGVLESMLNLGIYQIREAMPEIKELSIDSV